MPANPRKLTNVEELTDNAYQKTLLGEQYSAYTIPGLTDTLTQKQRIKNP